MANADYYIRKNDTLPVIGATMQNADGSVVDLTGGTYQFVITNADSGVVTATKMATTDGPAAGGKLQASVGPITEAGLYRGKFIVTFGGGQPLTFPNNSDILIQVYDGQPGNILTTTADYDGVRAYLGVTANDLSDPDIESPAFLGAAEAFVTKILKAQANAPSVTNIMTQNGSPAPTPADKTFLKAAVMYRLAYLFSVGETNAVDTAQTIGPVTKDLGGIGAQWKDQREEALKDCDQALGSITGVSRWRTL